MGICSTGLRRGRHEESSKQQVTDQATSSTEIIFDVHESLDGGYEARALGHGIFPQSESEAELNDMVRDAVRCHFEYEKDRPQIIRLHMVRDEIIPA